MSGEFQLERIEPRYWRVLWRDYFV